MQIKLVGRAGLDDPALAQHGDALAHGQRLELVGGGVHHGHAELAVQPLELGAGVVAQLGVEIGQRLVEQQEVGLLDQRAADREALLLAAGQGGGPARERVADAEHRGDRIDPLADLGAGYPALAQRVGEIVEGREMRVEREGLEDHRHVAALHRGIGDVAAGKEDPAGIRPLEPGDRAQGGGLAGSARSQDHEELALGDLEIEPVQGDHAAVALGEAGDAQRRHGSAVPPGARPPAAARAISLHEAPDILARLW